MKEKGTHFVRISFSKQEEMILVDRKKKKGVSSRQKEKLLDSLGLVFLGRSGRDQIVTFCEK